MKKILTVLIIMFSIFTLSINQALAINSDDLQSINGETEYYLPGQGQCNSGSSTSTPGSGAPDGADFPNLDPTAMANAINTWVNSQNPNSKLSGLGTTIVADGQHSNVNPFLIVSIAHEESSLADPSDYNVSHGNNSFGREAAAGQPSFQGTHSWYYWSSVEASVDYTATENQGKSYGGDMAAYLRDEYGSKLDSNDLLSVMEAYAPPSDNNTTQYVQNLQQWIAELIADTNTGGNTAAAPSVNNGCSDTVTCNNSNTSSSQSGLSTVRQNVVCIAQQQLTIWSSQPGYPWNGNNTYSETGYLAYSQQRQEEWCADFASWVYNQAGYPLAPDPKWDIAAVYVIQSIGQENGNFHWHPASSNYLPRPGDLAIHGSEHVNIVISVQGSTVNLIGGDQGDGPYPGGSIVSTEVAASPYSDGITGYVSPD